MGWAVIDATHRDPKAIAYGCITAPSKTAEERQLSLIHSGLSHLLKQYHPDAVSIESLFFATNAKTAIAVGQARGVALLAAGQAGIPVVSYTPLVVKQTITGTGTADKKQVQIMVTRLLHLPSVPRPDDAADALAAAMTHAYAYRLKRKLI